MEIKMRALRYVRVGLLGAVVLGLAAPVVYTQQTTGTPGSPDATTTIKGNQLPPPAPKFGGVIKDDALQSKAWWPPRVVPPKGAPNILLIMTMEKTIPIILQWEESFDIGSDTITGINDADYLPPFPLTAEFHKLTIKLDRPQLSPEEKKKLEEGMKKAAMGIQ